MDVPKMDTEMGMDCVVDIGMDMGSLNFRVIRKIYVVSVIFNKKL